jgi:hypothetical protein
MSRAAKQIAASFTHLLQRAPPENAEIAEFTNEFTAVFSAILIFPSEQAQRETAPQTFCQRISLCVKSA